MGLRPHTDAKEKVEVLGGDTRGAVGPEKGEFGRFRVVVRPGGVK
jgi:hypothetical protein